MAKPRRKQPTTPSINAILGGAGVAAAEAAAEDKPGGKSPAQAASQATQQYEQEIGGSGVAGIAGAQAQYERDQRAAERAARRQAKLVREYVTERESNRLAEQHTRKTGDGVELKVSPRKVGEDLKDSANRIRSRRRQILNDNRVQKANAQGKVVRRKGIERVDREITHREQVEDRKTDKVLAASKQAVKAMRRGQSPAEALSTSPILNKMAQSQADRRTEKDIESGKLGVGKDTSNFIEDAIRTVVGSDVVEGGLVGGVLGEEGIAEVGRRFNPAFLGDPNPSAGAALVGLAAPGAFKLAGKGIAALRTAQKPGEALLTTAIRTGVEKTAGKAGKAVAQRSPTLGAAGRGIQKGAGKVTKLPGAKRTGKFALKHPILATSGAAAGSGLAVGAAKEPGETLKGLAELPGKVASIDPDAALDDAGMLLRRAPEVAIRSAAKAFEDPGASAKGIAEVGISSIAFPFVVGKEAAQHGPTDALEKLAKEQAAILKEAWEPIWTENPDWDEFYSRLEENGANPILRLLEATGASAIASRGAMLPVKGGLKAAGSGASAKVFGDPFANKAAQALHSVKQRPDRRFTLGDEGVIRQRTSKGVIGRILQAGLDWARVKKELRALSQSGKVVRGTRDRKVRGEPPVKTRQRTEERTPDRSGNTLKELDGLIERQRQLIADMEADASWLADVDAIPSQVKKMRDQAIKFERIRLRDMEANYPRTFRHGGQTHLTRKFEAETLAAEFVRTQAAVAAAARKLRRAEKTKQNVPEARAAFREAETRFRAADAALTKFKRTPPPREVVPLSNTLRHRQERMATARRREEASLVHEIVTQPVLGHGHPRSPWAALRNSKQKHSGRGMRYWASKLKEDAWNSATFMSRSGARSKQSLIQWISTRTRTLPPGSPEIVALQQVRAWVNKASDKEFKRATQAADSFVRAGQMLETRNPRMDPRVGEGAFTAGEAHRYAEPAETFSMAGELPTLREALGMTPYERVREQRQFQETHTKAVRKEVESSTKAVKSAQESVKVARRGKMTPSKKKKLAQRESLLASERRRLTAKKKQLKQEERLLKERKRDEKEIGRTWGTRTEWKWAEDRIAYVRALGYTFLTTYMRDRGFTATPGYLPDITTAKGALGDRAAFRGKSAAGIQIKESGGHLARSGDRELAPEILLEHMFGQARGIKQMQFFKRVMESLAATPEEIAGVAWPTLANGRRRVTRDRIDQLLSRIEQLPKGEYVAVNPDALRRIKDWVQERQKAGESVSENELMRAIHNIANEADIVATPDKFADYLRAVRENPEEWANLEGWRFITKPTHEELGAPALGTGGKILLASKSLASRVILGLNPQWLGFQVYANAMVLGLANPRAFFGVGTAKRDRKQLDPLHMEAWNQTLGLTPHTLDYGNAGSLALASWAVQKAGFQDARVWRAIEGRSPLNMMFRLDYRNNRFFRDLFLTERVKRQSMKNMNVKMANILVGWDRLINAATGGKHKGKNLADYDRAFKEIASNRKEMIRLGKEVDEFMGEYLTFTARERSILANNVMFYGFLRHSLTLSLLTLPRHPIKANILAKMGQIAIEDQREMLVRVARRGVRTYVNVLDQRDQLPGGTRKEYVKHYMDELQAQGAFDSIPIPMLGDFIFEGPIDVPILGEIVGDGIHRFQTSRAAALGNVLLESKEPWQILNIANPFLTSFAEVLTGHDFYTGQPLRTLDETNPFGFNTLPFMEGVRHFASDLLSLVPPLRALSAGSSELPPSERAQGAFPLPGFLGEILPERKLEWSEEWRKLQQQVATRRYEALKGDAPWTSLAQTLAPFYPAERDALIGFYQIQGQIESEGDNDFLDTMRSEIQANLDDPFGVPKPWLRDEVKENPFEVKDVFDQDSADYMKGQGNGQRPTSSPPQLGPDAKRRGAEKSNALHASMNATLNPAPKKTQKQIQRQIVKRESKRVIESVIDIAVDVQGSGPDMKRLAALSVEYGQKYGIPPSVLFYQQGVESTFGTDIVGIPLPHIGEGPARGWTQFIPSTRQMMIDKHGVDPWADVESSVKAQAILLDESGYAENPSAALFSYNHSTDYVNGILEGSKNYAALDNPNLVAPDMKARTVQIEQSRPTLTVNKPGKYEVASGANREGVELSQELLDFTASAARKSGLEPTITTGSNHDQYTSSGYVSDHWDGNGADFGLAVNSGNDMAWGDRFAAGAYMAAGIPKDEAMQMARSPGTYNRFNVNGVGVQILWRVDGHYDHVHFGVQPGAGVTDSPVTSSGGVAGIPSPGGFSSTSPAAVGEFPPISGTATDTSGFSDPGKPVGRKRGGGKPSPLKLLSMIEDDSLGLPASQNAGTIPGFTRDVDAELAELDPELLRQRTLLRR